MTAVRREALTGDGGSVVGGVSPQVLGGLGGRLGQALRAAAVTHTGQEEGETAERFTMGRRRLIMKFKVQCGKSPGLIFNQTSNISGTSGRHVQQFSFRKSQLTVARIRAATNSFFLLSKLSTKFELKTCISKWVFKELFERKR